MEFGLLLTQYTTRWDHVAGDARLAEDVGLGSAWFVDHLLTLGDGTGPIMESWTALTGVAAITSRIRLGHLVLAAPFRNPGLLAKMAATLDHVSAGRLDLGLGAGWYEAEFAAFDVPYLPPGERRRYLEEYVTALRLLFEGGPANLDGRHIRLDDAYSLPVPVQEGGPPIVVGGSGPRMLDLAGRHADTWNCPYGAIPRLDELRGRVQSAAAGRPVRTTVQVPVAVGRSREEADRALELGSVHQAWMGDITESGIIGTLDEASAKVEEYAARGVDGIVAAVPGSRARPGLIEAYGELAARFSG